MKTKPPSHHHIRPAGASAGLLALLLLSTAPLHAAPASKTWDGSSNARWSVGANWAGNVAPVAGDFLVFPAGVARLVVSNDLPAAADLSGGVPIGGVTAPVATSSLRSSSSPDQSPTT